MNPPVMLVGCETSGVVRNAFAAAGWNAWSCDLLPSVNDHPKHLQRDVFDAFELLLPRLFIVHPPCTYICGSGLHWNDRGRGWEKTDDALDFVRRLFALETRVQGFCLENPVGLIGTKIRKASQWIQPYQFGEDASKKTGLWLKGLPLLLPTHYVHGRIVSGSRIPRWGNQTDSGQNRLGPSEDRWKMRSNTFPGIARAMAAQWTPILLP